MLFQEKGHFFFFRKMKTKSSLKMEYFSRKTTCRLAFLLLGCPTRGNVVFDVLHQRRFSLFFKQLNIHSSVFSEKKKYFPLLQAENLSHLLFNTSNKKSFESSDLIFSFRNSKTNSLLRIKTKELCTAFPRGMYQTLFILLPMAQVLGGCITFCEPVTDMWPRDPEKKQ